MTTTSTQRLPAGWVTAKLPELIASDGLLTDGDWVETKDQDPDGEVRLTQLADVGDGVFRDRSHRFLTHERAHDLNCTCLVAGDVLIARMPDPLGRACLFPGSSRPCVTVVDVCIARPGERSVEPRWLMHFVNAPVSRLAVEALQKGSTRKRISKANLCTIPIPVPPRAEQGRIAAALDSHLSRLDETVSLLERVQRNLNRYRASVLKAAVEGRLVPTEAELARAKRRDYEPASALLKRILAERRRRWEESGKRGRYEEPEAPDSSDLPELPTGWCWASLEHFLIAIQAGKNFQCLGRPPEEGEVGVVKVSAVTWGTFDEQESKTCPTPDLANEEHFIRPGDFLISRANTIQLVGACVIVSRIEKKLMLSDKILRLLTVDGFDPWLLWVLRSSHGRREIESLATGNQESMRNIGQDRIRAIRVPLPPEAECRRIVAEVERQITAIDHSEGVAEASRRRCLRLRQSILKWAFEGRLVDQDPSDEPASALLARIKGENAALASTGVSAPRRTKRKA